MNFTGTGRRLASEDITSAAQFLGCDEAAVKAVLTAEAKEKGFDSQNRPLILYEGHIFNRLTSGQYLEYRPVVAWKRWGDVPYGTRENSWNRLNEAVALDEAAALRATSWGIGQVLGDNFEVCGYDNVHDLVEEAKKGEDTQLMMMIRYIKGNYLDDELRNHQWTAFARGYNGPGYWRHKYDEKLALAYAQHGGRSSLKVLPSFVLRMGSSGPLVKQLQEALKHDFVSDLNVDGDFGPATKAALQMAQRTIGVIDDGVYGPVTQAGLRAYERRVA
jgi:hypothetical protein